MNNVEVYDGSTQFLTRVPKDAQVLVVGTASGAIDVARSSEEAGLRSVIAVSRRGGLPKVQPQIRDLSLEDEIETRVRSLEARVGPKSGAEGNLLHIFAEFSDLTKQIAPEFSWLQFLHPQSDAITELQQDIRLAKSGGADWQRIMLPLGPRVPRLRKLVSDAEWQRWARTYESAYLVYRHAMPIPTAEAVLALLQSGFLRVGTLCGQIEREGDRFFAPVILRPGGPQMVEATHVVVATGPNYMCTAKSENPLIRDMINSGLAEPHPLGGFKLEPGTLRLKDRPNIHCMGAMIKGEEHYINSMPCLVHQSMEIVHDLLRDGHIAR